MKLQVLILCPSISPSDSAWSLEHLLAHHSLQGSASPLLWPKTAHVQPCLSPRIFFCPTTSHASLIYALVPRDPLWPPTSTGYVVPHSKWSPCISVSDSTQWLSGISSALLKLSASLSRKGGSFPGSTELYICSAKTVSFHNCLFLLLPTGSK